MHMPNWTVGFPVRVRMGQYEVHLGTKMNTLYRGYRAGYGGKTEPGESPEQAMVRELQEEAGIQARDMRWVGQLRFHTAPSTRVCDIFVIERWCFHPRHTHEMRNPQWFPLDALPKRFAHPQDRAWLPTVVRNRAVQVVVHVYPHARVITYKTKGGR